MSFRLFSLLVLSSLIVGGCSKYMPKLDKVLPDQRKEYQKSKSLPDLEVPPDLTTETIDDSLSVPDVDAGGSATFSTYQERVARQKENRLYSDATDAASFAELSGEQLIIVSGSTSDTWITLQELWNDLGYTLDLSDEELGIMETNWSDGTSSREKYKVFIEPGEEDGETAIYLSHLGEDFDQNAWTGRNRDLPLERKMASRMRTSFGIAPTPSTTTVAAETVTEDNSNAQASDEITSELVSAGDDKMYLAVNSDVDTTWPRVGEFLNNASDISVEKEDPSKGTFDILYLGDEGKKKGIISKLAFWKSDNNEFQISLTGVGSNTEIVVLDEDGEQDTSGKAEQILSRIRSNL